MFEHQANVSGVKIRRTQQAEKRSHCSVLELRNQVGIGKDPELHQLLLFLDCVFVLFARSRRPPSIRDREATITEPEEEKFEYADRAAWEVEVEFTFLPFPKSWLKGFNEVV